MRDTILIVDNEEENRELLKQIFADKYKILTAENGKEGLLLLGQHMNEIAIILLEIVMPIINGYQMLQVLCNKKIIEKIPVVLITGKCDYQTELQCYQLGASDVITKPFSAEIARKKVDHIVDMYYNMDLLMQKVKVQENRLANQEKKIMEFNERLIDVISNVVEFRDADSGEHTKRLKELSRIIAKAYQKLYPDSGMTDQRVEIISKAAALHDIGKLVISDTILLKSGKLTEEERQIMMGHTSKGCEILNLLVGFQDEEQFKTSYEICRHHHERYDGKGYPDGLVGEEIPLSAQIVSIVDAYDALVSERIYKKPYDKEIAYNMIMNGDCGQFSPRMLACLKEAKAEIENLANQNFWDM